MTCQHRLAQSYQTWRKPFEVWTRAFSIAACPADWLQQPVQPLLIGRRRAFLWSIVVPFLLPSLFIRDAQDQAVIAGTGSAVAGILECRSQNVPDVQRNAIFLCMDLDPVALQP